MSALAHAWLNIIVILVVLLGIMPNQSLDMAVKAAAIFGG